MIVSIEEIKKFRALLENVVVNEAYEDRVRQIADSIVQQFHGQPVTKQELTIAIKNGIISAKNRGMSMGSLKPEEMVKDVIKAISNQIKIKKTAGPKTQARQELSKMVDDLSWEIPSLVGATFPDGDPIDMVGEWYRKNRNAISTLLYAIDEYNPQGFFWDKMWPAAEKKFCKEYGCKDLHDYCAQLWDEHSGDMGLSGQSNPYR